MPAASTCWTASFINIKPLAPAYTGRLTVLPFLEAHLALAGQAIVSTYMGRSGKQSASLPAERAQQSG